MKQNITRTFSAIYQETDKPETLQEQTLSIPTIGRLLMDTDYTVFTIICHEEIKKGRKVTHKDIHLNAWKEREEIWQLLYPNH